MPTGTSACHSACCALIPPGKGCGSISMQRHPCHERDGSSKRRHVSSQLGSPCNTVTCTTRQASCDGRVHPVCFTFQDQACIVRASETMRLCLARIARFTATPSCVRLRQLRTSPKHPDGTLRRMRNALPRPSVRSVRRAVFAAVHLGYPLLGVVFVPEESASSHSALDSRVHGSANVSRRDPAPIQRTAALRNKSICTAGGWHAAWRTRER